MNSLKPSQFSLIVPIAGDRPEYENHLPIVFSLDADGIMMCLKSIQGLNLDAFSSIYLTVLDKHCKAYDVDTMLDLQLRRLGLREKTHIVILEEATLNQVETIAKTIEKGKITGPIFIKDADSRFKATAMPENGVTVFPLEELRRVDPQHKSYVAVDDMQHVTNIIEKKVVSHLFNAGGYTFESAEVFCREYKKLRGLGDHLYLSHLIYSMLLHGYTFRPIYVKDYYDSNCSIE